MGLLSMKCTEEEMIASMQEQLEWDESVDAAVYCTFQDTGLLATRMVQAGYVGWTSAGRLVAVRYGMMDTERYTIERDTVRKIKVSKGLLGTTIVEIQYDYRPGKKWTLKFQYVKKVGGKKFPHQEEWGAVIKEQLSAWM